VQRSIAEQNTGQPAQEGERKIQSVCCGAGRTQRKATTQFATVWQGFPFILTEHSNNF